MCYCILCDFAWVQPTISLRKVLTFVRATVKNMSVKNNFQGFGGKLKSEALLKSVLGGVAIGGAVAFVVAAVSWFMEMNGIILCIAAFVAVTLLSAVLLYLLAFKPTVVKNARRLDSYGLEERLITMVELDGNDSLIAQKQREDSMAALARLNAKKVKISISVALIVLPLIFVLVFGGMTAVETLSEMEILPSGAEVWEMLFPAEPLEDFRVSYKVGAGGYLIGEADQTVTEGEYSSRVLAVADDGYMFYGWSDGNSNPSRHDKVVDRHIEATAIFIKVEEAKDNTEDEDEPDDVPGKGQGDSSDPSEGSGGGKYVEINQIIDGKEYYRDHYEEYYARVIALAESGEQIPEELLAIVEAYFNVIK